MSIARTVLREQVKDVLLERILRGELEPGERLVETRLARELGTSQAPVREALRDLELLRLVESEPFRGSRVRAVDDSQLLPVFPVRAALEELAASEAARNGSDVGALDDELESMREAAAAADWRTQIAHDVAFHRTMVELAGNEAAAAVLARARRRGLDRVRDVPDLVGSDRARRVPRPDRRGDPGRRLQARRCRGAQARPTDRAGGASAGSSRFR